MPSKSNSRSKNRRLQPQAKKVTRNWSELPSDLMINILQRVGAVDIIQNAERVCTAWREICKDPAMWTVVYIHMEQHSLRRLAYEKMCKHAVDRSQGQMVGLTIIGLCNPAILYYVANRSSQLRRLEIICSYDEVCGHLSEALNKLPLLEELSLKRTNIWQEDIEAAGRYCPLLKTLKLNRTSRKLWHGIENNEIALAIGKNLPQLSHLQLIGQCMRYNGLLAILDGCRQLESLDLNFCLCAGLTVDLRKRFSQQIKYLTLGYFPKR